MKNHRPSTLCLVLFLLCACASARAQTCEYKSDAPLEFHADSEHIYDQYGRVAVMRGVNMAAAYRDPFPYNEADLDAIAPFGYNLIRLPLSWRTLEPVEGQLDRAKLEDYKNFIRMARARGVYVMPDVHQVQWCASGMIPDWMCNEKSGHGILVDAIKRETDRFWHSEELQGKFVAFWEFLAMEFRDEPGIFAYDILNEPFSYDAVSFGVLEKCCLYPFYKRNIAAIRAIDPVTPIALEPPPLNVLLPAYTEKLPFDNLVWAPHAYYPHSYSDKGYSVDKQETPADARVKYQRFAKEAAGMGAPLLIGEFGMCGWDKYDFMPPWLEENMRMQERLFASSAVWDYGRGGKGWNILDQDGNPQPDKFPILHRPYPRYTAGTPDRMQYDRDTKTFRYRFTADPDICAPTEIYLPPELFGGNPDITVSTPCATDWYYNKENRKMLIPSRCAGMVEISAVSGLE